MADGLVQVSPDSSGKKIDTSEITVGTNTVERQRINISDPTAATAIAAVKAASTAAAATDPALVVAVSPNNTIPVSWTAPTGASGQVVQGTAAEAATAVGNPIVVAGIDAANATRAITTDPVGNVITKNFDGVAVPRTTICIYCDDITGVASESVLSCSVNKAGSVTTSQTSYTVTAGKTLRITSFSAYITGTTTTAAGAKVRIRQAASSVGATSPIIMTLGVGMPAAVATASNGNTAVFGVGIEVAASQQICLSQLATSTSSKVSACLTGFEY